jgi:nucleotide-binding universal stress UspA family protein
MIQHILFPTDGSETARKALDYILPMAEKFSAKITLLHTYDFTMGHVMSRYSSDSATLHEMESTIADYGQRMLRDLRAELEAQGFEVHNTFNEKGASGQWIVRVAEREHCDLIVMGSHGMGFIKSVLLGSTSHYVVNHSRKIPVFLVPVED